MTIKEIIETLQPVKPMTRATLYTYLRILGIKPIGKVRQSPQLYPDDTPVKIRHLLGH
ncbi:MAG: hypothetical protein KGJ60_09515 [Verrucomicrobiota bacterium]|nr:hypothetical protein [Verrucomicrobiota bacterium]